MRLHIHLHQPHPLQSPESSPPVLTPAHHYLSTQYIHIPGSLTHCQMFFIFMWDILAHFTLTSTLLGFDVLFLPLPPKWPSLLFLIKSSLPELLYVAAHRGCCIRVCNGKLYLTASATSPVPSVPRNLLSVTMLLHHLTCWLPIPRPPSLPDIFCSTTCCSVNAAFVCAWSPWQFSWTFLSCSPTLGFLAPCPFPPATYLL